MARAFRRLIELLDARRRLRRRGRGGSSALRAPLTSEDRGGSSALGAPPTSDDRGGSSALRAPPTSDDRAAPQPSELLRPPTTGAALQPSELLRPPTTETVQERNSTIGSADDPETIACLALTPHLMKYIKGGGAVNGKVRSTQKRQLFLERRIVELAVEHNQGTVLERLHAPKVDPLVKIVRVSTSMEVKIASWLLNNKACQFKVAVWGHVTDEELGLLLQEARNEGLTLYHLESHN